MYIKWIKISNFRGIKGGYFPFKSGLNILIGPSNVGKSTVLTAIDYVLNPNYSWWRRDILCELDFYTKNINKSIEIKLMLGCGPYRCTTTNGNCPRFEIGDETCKLADRLICVDKNTQKILKADDISQENAENIESCVLVQMKAEYKDSDGYVDVIHNILNEDGDIWCDLTRPMKEWIGSLLFVSGSNPANDCRLQYNSLLYRAIGDIGPWEQDYINAFKTKLKEPIDILTQNQAKTVIERFKTQSNLLSPLIKGDPSIGIQGTDKRDLLRQVELCFKIKDFELPLSRYGRGMQNIASMLMATIAQSITKKIRPAISIVMIEEPEQNLEPQLQRSILRFIQNLLHKEDINRQIIVTTHSPYIIYSDLKLEPVIKLQQNKHGGVKGKFLKEIQVNSKNFINIRTHVANDSELFESLFSNLVIVWEGASEAGLYNAFMRNKENFPLELLTGIDGQGTNLTDICQWFKSAGYDVIAVIDSDNNMPDELSSKQIPFISLPEGDKIEHIIADILLSQNDKESSHTLLKTIGATGFINKAEGHVDWPDLKKVFDDNSGKNNLATNEVIKSLEFTSLPSRDVVIKYLEEYKGRNYRDTLGQELISRNIDIKIFDTVLSKLKEIWFDRSKLGTYQFNNKGILDPYDPN